jgi:hypothetical protein
VKESPFRQGERQTFYAALPTVGKTIHERFPLRWNSTCRATENHHRRPNVRDPDNGADVGRTLGSPLRLKRQSYSGRLGGKKELTVGETAPRRGPARCSRYDAVFLGKRYLDRTSPDRGQLWRKPRCGWYWKIACVVCSDEAERAHEQTMRRIKWPSNWVPGGTEV